MNQRRQIGLVAAAATILATAPMSTIFQTWTWLIDCVLAVAVVCGAALLARSLRAPVWAQAAVMVCALTMLVTLLFGSHAFAGVFPTTATLRQFRDLITQAAGDIRNLGVPVPDRNGLLFLVTAGVGGVAILADLFTVGLRQPALAGMPMLPLYSIPVIVHQDSISFVPFVIGAFGFLWLLSSDNVDRVRRFGRRFTGDGRDVDLWEPSPLAAAGRRLAAVGLVLAVVVPLAVPGMSSGLLDRFSGGGDGTGSGIGSGRPGASVNLFAVLEGHLNANRTINMVRVTTNDPSPYYLRFGVADQLTASGFTTRNPVGVQPVAKGVPDPTLNLAGVTQATYTAKIQIINYAMGLLPIYTSLKATSSQLDRNWLYDPSGQLVYSTRTSSSKVKSYQFDYVRSQFSPEALRSTPPMSGNDPMVRQYTRLPQRLNYVQSLVSRLTAGKTNEYDAVLALYGYFSAKNNFSYSVSTRMGTSGSEIVDFLTGKVGYCEQYAAALAWLVRQAGYPSRVAFGFTRGEGRSGDTYTLTNLNLHAWTEVYFNHYGWIPFDATPSVGLVGPVSTPWAPNVDQGGTFSEQVPGVASSGAASSPGPNGAVNPRNAGDGPNDSGGTVVQPTATWPYWLLAGILALLVLLIQPALRRVLLRRRRGLGRRPARALAVEPEAAPGEPRVVPEGLVDGAAARHQAHAAWDELVDTLIDYDVAVNEAETPRVTAQRLVTQLRLTQVAADGARLLGRAEERARYARSPLDEVGLGGAVRDVRRAITHYVPWRTRLRAAVLPPSVLRRWRYRTGEALGGMLAAGGRAWNTAARSVSPRRLIPGRGGR